MMSFVMLPLSFIASLYSMNTVAIPLVGLRNDFWIVLGIMCVLGLAIILTFKGKKWF
jgi:Mg2+ and Co2+ transporter CorA